MEGVTEVASVRSCEKLPLCLIKPVPAGFKTDTPLAKAKPVSNDGSASVITYLRRKTPFCKGILQLEEGVRIKEQNHRIIESLRLDKASKVIKSNHPPNTTIPMKPPVLISNHEPCMVCFLPCPAEDLK